MVREITWREKCTDIDYLASCTSVDTYGTSVTPCYSQGRILWRHSRATNIVDEIESSIKITSPETSYLSGDTNSLLGYPMSVKINCIDEIIVTDVVYRYIPNLPRGIQ